VMEVCQREESFQGLAAVSSPLLVSCSSTSIAFLQPCHCRPLAYDTSSNEGAPGPCAFVSLVAERISEQPCEYQQPDQVVHRLTLKKKETAFSSYLELKELMVRIWTTACACSCEGLLEYLNIAQC